jgi:hypothetical protein
MDSATINGPSNRIAQHFVRSLLGNADLARDFVAVQRERQQRSAR